MLITRLLAPAALISQFPELFRENLPVVGTGVDFIQCAERLSTEYGISFDAVASIGQANGIYRVLDHADAAGPFSENRIGDERRHARVVDAV